MNKKLTLLIGIMAFFAMKMSAQDEYQFGLYLGMGANTATINSDMYYDDDIPVINKLDTTLIYYLPIENASVTPIPSFTIGAYYEIPVNDIVGIQMHLLYNKYGYRISGKVNQEDISDDETVEYDYTGTLKMSNISGSVLLKFNIPTMDLSFHAGVTPSLCVRMNKDIERGALHKTLTYNSKDEYNAFNVCGTLGVTWYWFECFFCTLNVNIGLVDVLKVKEPYYSTDGQNTVTKYRYSDTKSKTNSAYLTVGYRW